MARRAKVVRGVGGGVLAAAGRWPARVGAKDARFVRGGGRISVMNGVRVVEGRRSQQHAQKIVGRRAAGRPGWGFSRSRREAASSDGGAPELRWATGRSHRLDLSRVDVSVLTWRRAGLRTRTTTRASISASVVTTKKSPCVSRLFSPNLLLDDVPRRRPDEGRDAAGLAAQAPDRRRGDDAATRLRRRTAQLVAARVKRPLARTRPHARSVEDRTARAVATSADERSCLLAAPRRCGFRETDVPTAADSSYARERRAPRGSPRRPTRRRRPT